MWLLIALAALTVFWILNIYFRDDGTKLKHSPVIDEPPQQKENTRLINALTWAVCLSLAAALGFIFF